MCHKIFYISYKCSCFIHPDEFASSTLSVGAFFRQCSLKGPLGKMQKVAQCSTSLKMLIDFPCFRQALTGCNITSGPVLPLHVIFL